MTIMTIMTWDTKLVLSAVVKSIQERACIMEEDSSIEPAEELPRFSDIDFTGDMICRKVTIMTIMTI